MSDFKIYSTCPQSKDQAGAGSEYATKVAEVARWSEAAGFEGMLVYTDNGLVDPWLVAQLAIEATGRLRPLVATQPVYMHPYSIAKMVASLAYLHGRAVDLNFLAGGFKNDLVALGDAVHHDDRYERTIEYGSIVSHLIAGAGPTTLDGRFYQVSGLRLTPPVSESLRPRLLISGSSEAGLAAARSLGATAVRYPQPADEERSDVPGGITHGIRVGIIARDDDGEAWRVALERFPEDRKGQIAHGLAMKTSDSEWHRQLSATRIGGGDERDPYWLGPFNNYATFCPYLVGSYDRVADALAPYLAAGATTLITDIPREPEDLEHVRVVLDRALLAQRAR